MIPLPLASSRFVMEPRNIGNFDYFGDKFTKDKCFFVNVRPKYMYIFQIFEKVDKKIPYEHRMPIHSNYDWREKNFL